MYDVSCSGHLEVGESLKRALMRKANKCDDLTWSPVDELPSNLIETRKVMIDNYLNDHSYSEYNFK